MPQVFFRGPMLTIRTGPVGGSQTIRSILIPDGTTGTPYPDGFPSRLHTTGMFVVRGGVSDPVIFLPGNDLVITDAVGGPCLADPSLNQKIPLRRLVDKGPLPLRPRAARTQEIAATVELRGGVLAVEPWTGSQNPYNFSAAFSKKPLSRGNIPLISAWSATGNVTVTGATAAPIVLTGDDELYIFNFDKPSNSVLFYRTILDVCNLRGGSTADDDFKWVYHVFDVPACTWPTWCNGSELPSPVTHCGQVTHNEIGELIARRPSASPDDGDCIDALWDE